MHLHAIIRGIKKEQDDFINQLTGKYIPFKWKDTENPGSGKLVDCMTQLQVHPIQLMEFVFPEEHKDVVFATILNDNKGIPFHSEHQKYLWALRKMLGDDPIPEYKTDLKFPIARHALDVTGIGIKKDYWINEKGEKSDVKKEGYWEGL